MCDELLVWDVLCFDWLWCDIGVIGGIEIWTVEMRGATMSSNTDFELLSWCFCDALDPFVWIIWKVCG